MAAVTSAVIKVRASFADETHRDIEIGPLAANSAAITNIKTNLAAFNENLAAIAPYFLSDDGASCTGITAAQYSVETHEQINLND